MSVTVSGGIALPLALGVAFGIIIFIVGILIIGFCIWRRRNPSYLQVVRMADGSGKEKYFTFISLYGIPLVNLKKRKITLDSN